MKRLIILSLILFCYTTKGWCEIDFSRVTYTIRHTSSWMSEENWDRTFQYRESKVVNGHTYWLVPSAFPELWIREEDSRVYALCAIDSLDLVLYDYSLNAGDSLPGIIVVSDYPAVYDYAKNHTAELSEGESLCDYTIYIDSIGYTTLKDGKHARTQYIRYNTSLLASEMGIIENVGALRGLESIIFYPISTDGARNTLLCYHVDNVLVYEMGTDLCPHRGTSTLSITQQDIPLYSSKYMSNGILFININEQTIDILGRKLK